MAVAQRVTAGEVAVNVVDRLLLKLLGQRQIAHHQQVGTLHGALGPPERRAQCQTHRDQQQGIESGERLQAHARLAKQFGGLARYGSLMSFA